MCGDECMKLRSQGAVYIYSYIDQACSSKLK